MRALGSVPREDMCPKCLWNKASEWTELQNKQSKLDIAAGERQPTAVAGFPHPFQSLIEDTKLGEYTEDLNSMTPCLHLTGVCGHPPGTAGCTARQGTLHIYQHRPMHFNRVTLL